MTMARIYIFIQNITPNLSKIEKEQLKNDTRIVIHP
jgi:hypothetical protein